MNIQKAEFEEINNHIRLLGDYFDLEEDYRDNSTYDEVLHACINLSYDIGSEYLERKYGRPIEDFAEVEGQLGYIMNNLEEYLEDSKNTSSLDKNKLADLARFYSEIESHLEKEGLLEETDEKIGVGVHLNSKREIEQDFEKTLERIAEELE